MTIRPTIILALVLLALTASKPAAAQQRLPLPPDYPGPDAYQLRIGDVVPVASESPVFEIRQCTVHESSEPATLQPPIPDPWIDRKPITVEPINPGQYFPAPAVVDDSGKGFFAGGEVTLLRPFAGDISELQLMIPSVNVDWISERPSDQIGAAPRVWFGYTGSRDVGMRVRYWQLDQHLIAEGSDTSLDGILPPGSRRVGQGRLNMYTVDLEMTQHSHPQLLSVDVAVGMRVSGIDHDRSLTFEIPNHPDTNFVFNRNFAGFGPTMAAEVRRPLGDSPFTFLISPRGTMQFGHLRTELDVDHEFDVAGTTVPIINFFARSDAELYTAELRFGVEWSHDYCCGRKVFAHILWENQFWAGSGVGLAGVGLTGCTFGLGMRH